MTDKNQAPENEEDVAEVLDIATADELENIQQTFGEADAGPQVDALDARDEIEDDAEDDEDS